MYYEILHKNANTGELDTFWIEGDSVPLGESPEFPKVEGDHYLLLRRVENDFVWCGFSGSRHPGWE